GSRRAPSPLRLDSSPARSAVCYAYDRAFHDHAFCLVRLLIEAHRVLRLDARFAPPHLRSEHTLSCARQAASGTFGAISHFAAVARAWMRAPCLYRLSLPLFGVRWSVAEQRPSVWARVI